MSENNEIVQVIRYRLYCNDCNQDTPHLIVEIKSQRYCGLKCINCDKINYGIKKKGWMKNRGNKNNAIR